MKRYLLWLSLMTLSTLTQQTQGALRCGSSLVSEGDWPLEVEERCGVPDYVAEYPTATLPGLGVVQTEEHWYYNRGPQQFVQRLVFRNGKLAGVESLGYGFHTSENARCSSRVLRQASNEYELVARCGEPLSKNVEWRFPNQQWHANRWQTGHPVLVQEWLYDLSRNQFRQVVTLRNGKVTSVESRAGSP